MEADQHFTIELDGKQHSFAEFWPPDSVAHNAISLELVQRHTTERCFVYRICKKHIAFIQPTAVFDSFLRGKTPCTALDCKVCRMFYDPRNCTRASTHESKAYQAMQALPEDFRIFDCNWHTDVRILGAKYSSADIYVHRLRLCIMVDGEHHFAKRQRKPKSSMPVQLTANSIRQQTIDRKFDHEALRLGFSVLRLHYRDRSLFEKIVFNVLLSLKEGAQTRIAFSLFFGNSLDGEFLANLLRRSVSEHDAL